MFYAQSTGGFYSVEFHGQNIPSDAVEISYEYYVYLLDSEREGKIIRPDENGYPLIFERDPPTDEKLREIYQKEAKKLLLKTDRTALRCFKAGIDFPKDWEMYTESLRKIVSSSTVDHTQPFPNQPDYPVGS